MGERRFEVSTLDKLRLAEAVRRELISQNVADQLAEVHRETGQSLMEMASTGSPLFGTVRSHTFLNDLAAVFQLQEDEL